ncbi:hypothetical protein GWI33_022578 [Rhynchophorus ferrugineus]|uniref:Uncharacterized protein n=1 Tax=Rhynchophorus ferrugineus TaxID=354439 RepID=A0A834IQ31_RHYFE|nr:hypothetical protein GWI33_022578 [Rhynchophorus ferrugineus]
MNIQRATDGTTSQLQVLVEYAVRRGANVIRVVYCGSETVGGFSKELDVVQKRDFCTPTLFYFANGVQ